VGEPEGCVPAGRAGFSAPEGEVALRLQQLARVTSELGAADTMEGIVDAAVNHIAGAIGAAVTTLMVRHGSELEMVGGHGLQEGIWEQWQRFGVDDDNPASEAVRLGRPVGVGSVAETEHRYPVLRGQVPAGRSVLCLPLGAESPVGVMGLTFEDGWLPGPGELDFLTTFAEACGQAINRVRSAGQAAERARHLTFLAEASAELGRSLDYRSTLTNVANLVVPVLADWCAVAVLENGELSTLAVAHVDPEKVAWAWQLQSRYPPDIDAPTGAPRVVRTGESELVERVTDEMLAASARDEEHLRMARDLHLRSAIIVPLVTHDRTLGAITLLRSDDDRPYRPSDLAVAEDLGRRAGVAIDNAMLHGQARDTAVQLQRAVLPSALDTIPGWQIAAHYEPGGHAEVGGDFYDAVALPDGRLAVFIGDVMGHGIPAAAAMAQLRASVRAYLCVDPSPDVVLSKLERMFQLLAITRLVTCVYGLVDPVTQRLELVNAGHYAPLIVHRDRPADWAETPPRRLLGADPDQCATTTFPFTPGDTLLMFTDGLVERRQEVIDVGLKRAYDHSDGLRDGDLAAALRAFIDAVHAGDGDDDITALAVRTNPAS
jgi:GAF domain-containing protein